MLLILSLVLFALAPAHAEVENIENMSLTDLLNISTTVASQTTKTARTTPGIVTVITREEIENMGARDLIDVLYMVPGLDFGHDVQGTVGLAVRGNWAHEGKFSLVIDGQEMNEILYSTTQFGNHYPVDHIKRIEIIRGPGSAIYGGYAELAVISVTTLSGEDLNGVTLDATYGQMREDYGRRNLSLQWGDVVGDWNLSLAAFVGQGRRGDSSYTGYVSTGSSPAYDFETYKYAENDANNLNPHWYNFGASNGKWDIRLIHDQYRTTTRGMFGYSGLEEGIRNDFTSTYLGVSYLGQVSEKMTLTPYLRYKRQKPFEQHDRRVVTCCETDLYELLVERVKVGLSSTYSLSPQIEFLAGLEVYRDTGEALVWNDGTDDLTFNITGEEEVEYNGRAVYAQGAFDFELAEFTLGGRWEELETPLGATVSSFVPRAALTKAEDEWHFKALASQAYRTPAITNFDLDYTDGSSDIDPETTTTYEIEYGHSLGVKSYLTANVFYINIDDPIVYQYIDDEEYYLNFPKVATQGFELEYRMRDSWGYANLGYSFYEVAENKVDEYRVDADPDQLIGFPNNKVTLNSSIKTGWGNLRVNPSLVYLGSKYTYSYDKSQDEEVQEELPAVFLTNLYLSYENAWVEGLKVGTGVFNLLDEDHRFVQPYNGELGHVPSPSQEFIAKVEYHWGF